MKNYAGQGTLTKLCDLVKSDIGKLRNAVTTAKEAADNAQQTANAAKTTAEAALPKSGGTITGNIYFNSDIIISSLGIKENPVLSCWYDNNLMQFKADDHTTDIQNGIRISGIKNPINYHDAANKLYVDSSIVRQNLLDNSYFLNPVNQRGQSNYTVNGYCIDRWSLYNSSLDVTSSEITLTASSAFGRIIQKPGINLAGKKVTFSLLYDGLSAGSILLYSYHNDTPYAYSSDGSGLITATFTFPSDYSVGNGYIYIALNTNGAHVNLRAVKIEIGSFQTLAHQENGEWVLNEIPDYTTELLKCQKYQLVPTHNISTFGTLGFGCADSATSVQFAISIPTPFRAAPSIIMSGNYEIRGNGNRIPFNSNNMTISSTQYSEGYLHLDLSGFSGLIPWTQYLLFNGDGNNNLIFDANL